ncbi:unnamed protein product [Camellia sinensis]
MNQNQNQKEKENSTLCPNRVSGSHTIGQARCTVFKSHIYNDANINAEENARTEGVA